MARTKAVLGAGARLSDYLSASLLARVYPAAMIGEILDEHGCTSKRIRSFPAVPGTYFCMALSLYPEAAYEQVFAVVSQGLSWMHGTNQMRLSPSPPSAKCAARLAMRRYRTWWRAPVYRSPTQNTIPMPSIPDCAWLQ